MSPHIRSFVFAALFAPAVPGHAVITCQIQGSGMSFPPYDVFGATPLDSVGSLTVNCIRNRGSPNATLLVTMGPSQNSGQTAIRRLRLQGGADLLDYNLFSDPSRSAVWGTGASGVARQINIPSSTGSTQEVFQIFGRIPPGQNVSVGNYSDVLTITVNP